MTGLALIVAAKASLLLAAQIEVVSIEDRNLDWVEGAIAWRTPTFGDPTARATTRSLLEERLASIQDGDLVTRVEPKPGGWRIRFGLPPAELSAWLEKTVAALKAPATRKERTRAKTRTQHALQRARADGQAVARLHWQRAVQPPLPAGASVLLGWRSDRACLVLVGAVTSAEARTLGESLDWPENSTATVGMEPFAPERPLRSIIVDRPDLERPEVMLGWTTTSTRWGSPASRAAALILIGRAFV